jgi:hypothetical protein
MLRTGEKFEEDEEEGWFETAEGDDGGETEGAGATMRWLAARERVAKEDVTEG